MSQGGSRSLNGNFISSLPHATFFAVDRMMRPDQTRHIGCLYVVYPPSAHDRVTPTGWYDVEVCLRGGSQLTWPEIRLPSYSPFSPLVIAGNGGIEGYSICKIWQDDQP